MIPMVSICIRRYLGSVYQNLMYRYVMQLSGNGSSMGTLPPWS